MRLLILLGLLLPALPAAAQTLDPTFTSPTSLYQPGAVSSIGPAQTDGKRLVAGYFSRVNNAATGGLVRLDAAGALDQPFQQNVGLASNVLALKAGLSGQYLLGAQDGATPLRAGGLTRTQVLRLNADGTGDASFDAGTGPAAAPGSTNAAYANDYAVQPDGKVLVGGKFERYSGTAAAGLLRLNVNGSVDTGFSVGTGVNTTTSTSPSQGEIRALLVLPGGQVLAGGYFTSFNGQTVNSLVRLSASGSVDATLAVALQSGSLVNSLTLQPDGKILVTGYLNLGNNSDVRLVRLLASGALDPSFTADATLAYGLTNSTAPLALQPDGKILIIGYSSTNGAKALARLNANGSPDNGFTVSAPPSNSLSAVGVQPSGNILVGTNDILNLFNGAQEATLAQYTSTGSLDATYQPKVQLASSVLALARQNDGSLLAGGYFTEWNGQPVHRLVHLSATGTLDAAFTSQVGLLTGAVNTLAVQPDSRILVGGTTGVRRLAASGAPDASFSSALGNKFISRLVLQPDGKLLVGGDFALNRPNGTVAPSLVRLTSAGVLDPTFNATDFPGLGTLVYVSDLLLQPDGRIVTSGFHFDFTSGTSTGFYVSRYTSTGAPDANFTTQSPTGGPDYYPGIYALGQQADGKLLVGGSFTQLGGVTRPGFARLTTTGTLDGSFVPSSQFAGGVNSFAVQPNGRILLGGQFTLAGASTGANLTRVLATGQPDPSFAPTATPDNAVFTMLVQPNGAIVLAGRFSQLGSQPAAGLARITAPNVLAVTAPAATAARTSAWPVPAHELLHVAPDPSAQPQQVELLDALGRPVLQRALTSGAEFTLPTAGLPAGLYLLRVRYATGAVTRQLTIE